MYLLKISSKSDVNKCAGAIAITLKKTRSIQVQAIGANAVNQAVKAITTARTHLSGTKQDLDYTSTFNSVDVEDDMKITAILFDVKLKEKGE